MLALYRLKILSFGVIKEPDGFYSRKHRYFRIISGTECLWVTSGPLMLFKKADRPTIFQQSIKTAAIHPEVPPEIKE